MRRFWALAGLTCGLAVLGVSDDAQACGGCFVPETGGTIVTGHRMALSISLERTVLWDQIQYTGDPEDFSWVLPVKPGAVLEVANDAWFDVLEAATRTTVSVVQPQCFDDGFGEGSFGPGQDDAFAEGSGDGGGPFGCSSSDFAPSSGAAQDGEQFGSGAASGGFNAPPQPPEEDVDVVSEGSAGPYDMVTLSTDVPGALNEWLEDNGYVVPEEMQPIIDAYIADGFDFIALRLSPDISVKQMKPVRVITPGSSFALPLKMVAAGTGAETALTLFMLAEGRYESENFNNALLGEQQVTWDFIDASSDYSERRLETLAQNEGRTWLTSYARQGPLFEQVYDDLAMSGLSYNVGNNSASTIAEAYVMQGIQNGEAANVSTDCLAYFQAYAGEMAVVVDDVCEDGADCTAPSSGELPASNLACGDLDDVATAMVGMHPRDVWLTRMEANLPRTALDSDLMLQASMDQTTVENRFFAGQDVNSPCGQQGATLLRTPKKPRVPGGPVSIVLAAAALGLFTRRRRSRAAALPAAG